MKERGMLFSKPMVLALLDGSKTQTRRVVKLSDNGYHNYEFEGMVNGYGGQLVARFLASDQGLVKQEGIACPYGQPGDRIWVRETHSAYMLGIENGVRHYTRVRYKADGHKEEFDISSDLYHKLADAEVRGDWTPSIHMPRWASRIDLEITGVLVERLQDISKDDVIAEGCFPGTAMPANHQSAVNTYRDLWESLNGADSWDSDPWVWVITFKRVQP